MSPILIVLSMIAGELLAITFLLGLIAARITR